MRRIRRLWLVPLVLAAAAAIAAGPAHLASPAHPVTHALADCPAGSNWDNILQECV